MVVSFIGGENHGPVASDWHFYHIMLYQVHIYNLKAKVWVSRPWVPKLIRAAIGKKFLTRLECYF